MQLVKDFVEAAVETEKRILCQLLLLGHEGCLGFCSHLRHFSCEVFLHKLLLPTNLFEKEQHGDDQVLTSPFSLPFLF